MADLVSIDATTTSAHAPARAARTPAAAKTSFAATLTKVSGHAYAKVEGGGSEKDTYVNQAEGNVRKGQVFRLVERDGRSFHVYGDGPDATVVEVKAAAAPTAAPTADTGGAAAPG